MKIKEIREVTVEEYVEVHCASPEFTLLYRLSDEFQEACRLKCSAFSSPLGLYSTPEGVVIICLDL